MNACRCEWACVCECICALCKWTACAGDIRRVFPHHVHNLALNLCSLVWFPPQKKDLWQKPWQTAWPGSPFRLHNSPEPHFWFGNGLVQDSEIANARLTPNLWSDLLIYSQVLNVKRKCSEGASRFRSKVRNILYTSTQMWTHFPPDVCAMFNFNLSFSNIQNFSPPWQ